VLLIRRIRDLLYEQGFTINGARHRLETEAGVVAPEPVGRRAASSHVEDDRRAASLSSAQIRQVIEEIRALLGPSP
jgi:hypothetical protein